MSQSIVMLQIQPQPGLLLRLSAALSRFGLQVVGQQQHPLNAKGLSQLALTLKGARAVDAEVRAALLALEGVVQCNENQASGQPLDDASMQKLLREVFGKLEASFPQSLPLLREFGAELEPPQRQRALHALGRQMGRRKYRAEYAEGSPLPLAQALQRVVAHFMRTLTPIEIQGDNIVLTNSSLCDKAPGTHSSCAFFAGLVQGLLEDAPTTRGTTATLMRCRATAPTAPTAPHTCICTVHPATN